MDRLCPHCLKKLPPLDLPVCPHCAQRLPEAAAQPAPPTAASAAGWPPVVLPVRGDETAAELAHRFFTPPEVYSVGLARYLSVVLAPLALPLALTVLAMREPGGLPPWLAGSSWGLCLAAGLGLAILRWPPRWTVRLDAEGVRHGTRRWPWAAVRGVRSLSDERRGKIEPRTLELVLADGARVRIPREITLTARTRSLRNLAAMIELMVAKQEAQGSRAQGEC